MVGSGSYGRGDDAAQEEPTTTAMADDEGTCHAETGTCDNDTKYGLTASNITNCLATETSAYRPTYTADTFRQLRDIYRRVYEEYDDDMAEIEDEDEADEAGIVVPFVVQTVAGTDYRGVVSTTAIQRGQKVWSPLYLGEFATEESWLAFLQAILQELGRGQEELGTFLACDALQWSYVMGNDESGYSAVLDLDEGSFVNHAWLDPEEDEDANGSVPRANIVDGELAARFVPKNRDFCFSCMYANQDIAVGDEIRTDYTVFYVFGELEWYEASVAKAWNVDRSKRRQGTGERQWHYR